MITCQHKQPDDHPQNKILGKGCFLATLEAIPTQDWSRNWDADRTIMLTNFRVEHKRREGQQRTLHHDHDCNLIETRESESLASVLGLSRALTYLNLFPNGFDALANRMLRAA